MATFTGENGKVDITAEDSVGFTTVAEVRSWTVEHTKDVIDGALTVEFYPDAGTGQKFSGSVLVTSVSRTSSYDDLVTATVNFQGSGALAIGAV